MARLNHFDRLSQDLLHNIIGLAFKGPRSSNVLPSLKMIRLTCKALSIAGLEHVGGLRVRDSTEARHVKRTSSTRLAS